MSLTSDVRAWNPFNDMTPFSQMSEDNIFGAEFDKIRRGSQSSEYEAQMSVLGTDIAFWLHWPDFDPLGSL